MTESGREKQQAPVTNAAVDRGRSTGRLGVPDGEAIAAALERLRSEGRPARDLLREAVRRIKASSERFDWVGIYLLQDESLELACYLGKATEHVRIPVGTGVCGTAVAEGRDIIVDDVRQIDNYLACSVETRAELVVLVRDPATGRILGQIDLDSDEVGAFDERDRTELARVAGWLAQVLA